VGSDRVVVFTGIFIEQSAEMLLIQRDDVVEQLPPQSPVNPLAIWILPRTVIGSSDFFDAGVAKKGGHAGAVDSVVVTTYEPRQDSKSGCLPWLLDHPEHR
jgi:hypothetical protein